MINFIVLFAPLGGQRGQLCFEVPEEPGDVQAVGQCVVDEQRHRKSGAAVYRDVFAPADAGIAVVGVYRRMLQLGVMQPRQAGYEEEGPRVAVLGESAAAGPGR